MQYFWEDSILHVNSKWSPLFTVPFPGEAQQTREIVVDFIAHLFVRQTTVGICCVSSTNSMVRNKHYSEHTAALWQ